MSTSTPNAGRHRPPRGTTTPSGDTTLTGLQRLPIHSRYPLTPSRLINAATPGTQRSASRYTPRARGVGAPSTPYGLRARQQRAANTPGRDRRRSGRMQRETTFDILRNLGRALAPVSEPIRSSPQEKAEATPEPIDEFEQLDNEPEIERPRLSLPIQESEEEDEEASPEMHPPRMSLAFAEEDMDITYRSVEYPRDVSIRDRDRLSMMSRATGRISGDFEETRLESDDADDTGIMGEDDDAEDTMISGGDFDRGGETEDLGRFHFDLNFPSPVAAPLEDPIDGGMNDMEDFELSTADVEPLPAVSDDNDDDDDAGGGFGFGLDFPPAASPSESPGIVGGGMREEAIPTQGKQKKISRHGIPVPTLPAGVVKKLATRFARSGAGSKAKINKATLAAIEQASAWYFEQASQDLAAYSRHAGRKTIDESDVTTLLRRQRLINKSTTVFSLAQKHLPKELQQDMRLAMPP
ncbi:Histone-fold [Penicillium sp. IBT 31633x]|nr:Histone-fold [Penicillium sp. IBT 31633x]